MWGTQASEDIHWVIMVICNAFQGSYPGIPVDPCEIINRFALDLHISTVLISLHPEIPNVIKRPSLERPNELLFS